MSDLCPLCPRKQTLARVRVMSALPLKADTDQHGCDVRFVPQAGIGYTACTGATPELSPFECRMFDRFDETCRH